MRLSLVALFALGLLVISAVLSPAAVAKDDTRTYGSDPLQREQLRQQKAAEDAEEAEARERADRRWLQKLERDADPGLQQQPDDPLDGIFDDPFSSDMFLEEDTFDD